MTTTPQPMTEADALWFLSGYDIDTTTAHRILRHMTEWAVPFTSTNLRNWSATAHEASAA
ncbi:MULTISPECIES: hypothetical protein [unclassified Nocardia]|uniref:hypothetical protein n=1 Tax=unclassified Nocardia TaxID=2637762 RepID=UPI00278C5520|nr:MULTISPECIES: hypothetical protein [unclassified Nocardia]